MKKYGFVVLGLLVMVCNSSFGFRLIENAQAATPEIDPRSIISAITLLIGGALLISSRRQRN